MLVLMATFVCERAMGSVSVTTHWTSTPPSGAVWAPLCVTISSIRRSWTRWSFTRIPRCPDAAGHFAGRDPVAVLRKDGTICIVSISGSECVPIESALSHHQSFLDWPAGNWIYYTQGGFGQPSGSRILRRVDVATGLNELVTSFVKDDGVLDAGTWRVQVDRKLENAIVRSNDLAPEPWGRITMYLMLVANDGVLRLDRSTDRSSCSSGIEPSGERIIDRPDDHQGIEIRRFDDLSLLQTIRWVDVVKGDSYQVDGVVHNLNTWSVSSPDWVSIEARLERKRFQLFPARGQESDSAQLGYRGHNTGHEQSAELRRVRRLRRPVRVRRQWPPRISWLPSSSAW